MGLIKLLQNLFKKKTLDEKLFDEFRELDAFLEDNFNYGYVKIEIYNQNVMDLMLKYGLTYAQYEKKRQEYDRYNQDIRTIIRLAGGK